MFIINFLILIAPFADFVLFFSRWNIFLIFFLFLSFESVLLITSYPLMILLYKSWIDSLLSFAYLNFSRLHCNIFSNNSTLELLLVSNIEELEVCGDVSVDCPFVAMLLLCFVHLVNRLVFHVSPLIFHFCFICFILCEPSQWVACTWVCALYHYLQGKSIYQILWFKGAISRYL